MTRVHLIVGRAVSGPSGGFAQLLAEVHVLGEMKHVVLLNVLRHGLEQAVGGGGGDPTVAGGRQLVGSCQVTLS